jgi:hypothetical protein
VQITHTAAASLYVVYALCTDWAQSYLRNADRLPTETRVHEGRCHLLWLYTEIAKVWGHPGQAMDFGDWSDDDVFAPAAAGLVPAPDGHIELSGDLALAYLARRRREYLAGVFGEVG